MAFLFFSKKILENEKCLGCVIVTFYNLDAFALVVEFVCFNVLFVLSFGMTAVKLKGLIC